MEMTLTKKKKKIKIKRYEKGERRNKRLSGR
jgi:hypothetical protein